MDLQQSSWINAVLEESERLTHKEWNGRLYDGSDFLRSDAIVSMKIRKIMRGLWEWRDE